MGIDASGSIVLLSVRTPDRFVLVEVEVVVAGFQVNDFNFDFGLGVGEGAELLVLAFEHFAAVGLAELALVPGGVVDLFDFVVGEGAVGVLAFFGGTEFVTVVLEVGPPLVHAVVVVRAGFPLVVICFNLLLPLLGHTFVL